MIRFQSIREEALEANMQLPALGLVLLLWQCERCRSQPGRICYQAQWSTL